MSEGDLDICCSTNLLRDALTADSSTALPAPLRFPPRHLQTDRSLDLLLHTGHAGNAPDFLESPVFPASPSEATHASPSNDVTTQTQVFGITTEPSSLTLEDICTTQADDDSLQPVIQALLDGVKPSQESLRDFSGRGMNPLLSVGITRP